MYSFIRKTAIISGLVCSATMTNMAFASNDGLSVGQVAIDSAATPQAIGGASPQTIQIGRLGAIVAPLCGSMVLRSWGVASVTNPSVGQYCIKPSGSWDVNKVVPVLTTDWSCSSGTSLLVFYRSSGLGCSSGNISVLTYDFSSGSPTLSNNVAFTIFVD